MEQYAVTDGQHRHEFSRGTEAAAFAQARGLLVMDPAVRSDRAELQVWRNDTWESLGPVLQLPQQMPYHDRSEARSVPA